MNILFFNYEYPPLGGGAANATKELLAQYAAMGDVQVDLVTSSITSDYVCEEISPQVRVHRLPIGKDPENLNYQSQKELIMYTIKAYFFARKLLKQKRYDLSHAFFAVPCGVLSWLFHKQYGLSYIVSLRGADVPGYSERFTWLYGILRPLIVWVWRNATHVVTNSAGLRDLALQSNPQQTFDVIYNGVDTDFYHPQSIEGSLNTVYTSDQMHASDAKSFTILCAARLSRRKGFNYAIDAFAQIAADFPQARMVLAGGEGNAMEELQQQVQDLQLEDRVTFTGHYTREEAPAIYQQADVFLMPSLNEGMSNNLLEALASGLPVLMTPTGGAEELVRDGQNGYLIKMKDANDIAAKLRLLLANPEQAAQMGQVSRKIAEGMSWKAVAQEYVGLYEQTTNNSQHTAKRS